jgi:hypothetical protein
MREHAPCRGTEARAEGCRGVGEVGEEKSEVANVREFLVPWDVRTRPHAGGW